MNPATLVERLDEEIGEQHLLKHPFYQHWQAGTLSRERLQLYATQYYRHVEAFPVHLMTLAVRTNGGVGKHRKAKYYELTKAGCLEVKDEVHNGDRIASAIGRLLQAN